MPAESQAQMDWVALHKRWQGQQSAKAAAHEQSAAQQLTQGWPSGWCVARGLRHRQLLVAQQTSEAYHAQVNCNASTHDVSRLFTCMYCASRKRDGQTCTAELPAS